MGCSCTPWYNRVEWITWISESAHRFYKILRCYLLTWIHIGSIDSWIIMHRIIQHKMINIQLDLCLQSQQILELIHDGHMVQGYVAANILNHIIIGCILMRMTILKDYLSVFHEIYFLLLQQYISSRVRSSLPLSMQKILNRRTCTEEK